MKVGAIGGMDRFDTRHFTIRYVILSIALLGLPERLRYGRFLRREDPLGWLLVRARRESKAPS